METGQRISHYKILREIGHGGMGLVYQAEDSKLDRAVAIKVLPPHLTDDPQIKERFIREAQAASSLDHPNICSIHEIGETEDGQLFLVMAYYDGETLARKIQRGPLAFDETLAISRQLLRGLARAHESGMVHRDIKPANLMVTPRGEVKILDFGVAKLTGATELTQTGGPIGTVDYMSPEQAGGGTVDYRSDLWSAGVVLYEMLTGQRPFRGTHPHVILHAVLHEEARPVSSLRRGLPAVVDSVVDKALSKSPSLRYQSAQEFLREIEMLRSLASDPTTASVTTGPLLPRERSILVLPFANLHPDRTSDYFSDGLTDEIIADLSNVRALRVLSRSAAMRLKDTPQDIKKITEELHVGYVLEGSVRKSGDNLRVTAKLVDAVTDTVVWAETHSGNVEDVFSIQEVISRKIVGALKLNLTPKEDQKLAEVPISDFRAYEYYLKARQELLSYTKEGLERALEYLEGGRKIIGENVMLLSALGQTYWQFVNAGVSSDPAYLAKAQECAEKILALDSQSPHGYRLLGLVEVHRGQSQEGVRLLKRALATDPNDTDTLAWLVAIYGLHGKPYAAAPLVKRLMEIDPLTPSYQYLPGLLALMVGEFHRALAPFAKALQMEPSNPMTRLCYGQVLALNERMEESIETFNALFKDMPESFAAKLGRFYRDALRGSREQTLAAATPDLKDAAAGDPYYCWNLAQGFALIKENDEALYWLEKAVRLGFINYPLLSRLDPFLENVRRDLRFNQLIETVREQWEAFEV